MRTRGQIERITPFIAPTSWSDRPKSVVSVISGASIVRLKRVQRFYFDHNATTPVSPEVLETAVECLGQVYGNASSIHHFGQAAKQRLAMAQRQSSAVIGCQLLEIVFVSGGTEADNLALFGTGRCAKRPSRPVVPSPIEHPA